MRDLTGTPRPRRWRRGVWALLGAAALAGGCGTADEASVPETPGYAQPVPEYARRTAQVTPPPVTFTDVTKAAGIDFVHETGAFGDKWMPETMGAGAALFDADADGDDDALLVNGTWWAGHEKGGPPPTAALYANDGDGGFAEATAGSSLDVSVYGMGVTAADYDADGATDLYLTTLGPNLLLRNRGGLTYDEVGTAAGVAGSHWRDEEDRSHPEWSTGALWADVDNDGWPDLFVTNYVHWSPEHDLYASFDGKQKSYATPQQYPGSTPRLYRNTGDGGFVEVTRKAGVWLPEAKSMSVAATDVDGDGWVDLVVTNDTQPNYLLRNGGGRFEEIGMAAGIGYDESGRARAGMGVDVAALDATGRQAIGIGNFSREALSLYTQTAPDAAVFVDGAGRSRLVQPTLRTLTFGLRFLDYDLDGYRDLMLANGHIEPAINGVQKEIVYAQAPQLFWNDGAGSLLAADGGAPFAEPMVARGLAVGDLEGDGDPDVLLSTNGGPAHLLRNDGGAGAGAALVLELRGRAPNLGALGALATVTTAAGEQRLRVRTGSSYLSHSSTRLTFGLGPAAAATAVTVRWPDGSTQDLGPLAAGRHTIVQGQPAASR